MKISVLLGVAVLALMFMMLFRGRKELNVGEKSDALLYVENNEEPNAFVLYGMVKKITDDEATQIKVLDLATANKRTELLDILKTL